MELIEFGNIMRLEKGKKPLTQSNNCLDGYLPYVDIKAFELGIIDSYSDGEKCLPCSEGNILIVCDGSRSGLVGKAINGYVGSTLAKISAEGMSQKYLYYFLQGKYLLLYTKKKGTGTPHLNPNLLKKQLLVVPDETQQEKIVAKIDELFSELDKSEADLKTIKQQLKVYRQSVLKEAFEGKWKFSNRKDHKQIFNLVKDSELKELSQLPKEWDYVYLSELGLLQRGKSKHRPRNDAKLFEDGKYPFFQTGDVKSSNLLMNEYAKKYGEFGLSQSKLWNKGTLCITIAANIAETSFLGVDGCFPDSIVGFSPKDSIVDKHYVRYFIEASKLRLWAFAPATAQKNINLKTLENLLIPYCDIAEQKYIVEQIEARLSECDNIEKTVDKILKQSTAMRQSILKQAFEGKLI